MTAETTRPAPGLFPAPEPLPVAPDVPAGFPVDVGPGEPHGDAAIRIRELGEDGETLWAFGHVDPPVFLDAAAAFITRAEEQQMAAALQVSDGLGYGFLLPPGPEDGELDPGDVKHITWTVRSPWCAQAGTRDEDAGPDAPERPACAVECGLDHCGPWGFTEAPDPAPAGAVTFPATYLIRDL